MKKKVTIHDLARVLNIDSSTVSRALADSPRVKPKTKEMVVSKARELGYARNVMASNLRARKSHTIGVIVPYISRYFLATVISGIEEKASETGYQIMICQSHDRLDREEHLIDTLLANQVDGIIMSISMQTNTFDHLNRVAESGTPIVFFDRKCSAIDGVTNVVVDDYQMAFEATEHFIKTGRKRIAHFTGSQHVSIYRDRLSGYLDALRQHDIIVDQEIIFETQLLSSDGSALAKRILSLDRVPDAILSANDIAAISAMRVFEQMEIRVPEDIALIGFSNEPLSEYTHPPLTTIDQNPYQMGQVAFEAVLDKISGDNNHQPIHLIPSNIIYRSSSGE